MEAMLDPSNHPLLLSLVLMLCYLTSPVELLKLLPTILLKFPCVVGRSLLCYVCPSLFERDVSGDVVIITGAASGLGKLMSGKFSKLGAKVVMIDRDAAALKAARDEIIQGSSGNARHILPHIITCDLSDRAATYAAMSEAASSVGPCTILINNAGIVTGKKLLESSDAAIEATFRVNTLAHFWTIKAVLPAMLEADSGHIVSVASIAGLMGVSGLADYSASKAAVVSLDESLRLEVPRQRLKPKSARYHSLPMPPVR